MIIRKEDTTQVLRSWEPTWLIHRAQGTRLTCVESFSTMQRQPLILPPPAMLTRATVLTTPHCRYRH